MARPKLNDIERAFPAKFSAPILDALEEELRDRLLGCGVVLDCFGGVGGVHKLMDRMAAIETVAVDIEPEFAANHPRTVCGDSAKLATSARLQAAVAKVVNGQPITAVVTSPAYGNRLADQYLGSDAEQCRACTKSGDPFPQEGTDKLRWIDHDCSNCGGTGRAKSNRKGYAIAKGAKLSDGSGAALAWGDGYRSLHRRVMESVAAYVGPDVLWLVNVSSFIAQHEYKPVMEWWVGEVARHATVVGLRSVVTARHGEGANHEVRVPSEHIIIART